MSYTLGAGGAQAHEEHWGGSDQTMWAPSVPKTTTPSSDGYKSWFFGTGERLMGNPLAYIEFLARKFWYISTPIAVGLGFLIYKRVKK